MTNDRPTLRDIARAASDRHDGARGRELDRIAKAHNLTLSYTTVDKILNGTYHSRPKRETLQALAVLAGVPERVVFEAADIPLPQSRFKDQLPPDVDQLSPEQRRLVIDLTRGLLHQNRREQELQRRLATLEESDGRGNAAPMNQPAGDPGGNTTTTNHPRPDTTTPTDDLATRRATRERAGVGGGDGPAVSSAGFADLGGGFDEHGIPRPPEGLAALPSCGGGERRAGMSLAAG